jgi:hypothetical protein
MKMSIVANVLRGSGQLRSCSCIFRTCKSAGSSTLHHLSTLFTCLYLGCMRKGRNKSSAAWKRRLQEPKPTLFEINLILIIVHLLARAPQN